MGITRTLNRLTRQTEKAQVIEQDLRDAFAPKPLEQRIIKPIVLVPPSDDFDINFDRLAKILSKTEFASGITWQMNERVYRELKWLDEIGWELEDAYFLDLADMGDEE